MNRQNGSSIIRLIISTVLLITAVYVLLNRQPFIDQLTVWQFKPSAEIAALTERGSFSDEGTFLFYASRPRLEQRDAFNTHCRAHGEQTAILGCYAGRIIYLYDITDERLTGIKEVTAAHEMLHAAYDRLSADELKRVNMLINKTAREINNEQIEKKLALYDQSDPTERLNELHSMLGTEVKELPEELETYYAQYFTNRLSLVQLSESYEQVFAALEQQQKTLVAELNSLAATIDSDNQTYNQRFAQLQVDIESFNRRANNGSFTSQSAFNAERSQLIARQNQLTQLRNTIVANIELYDKKKIELDALNITAAGLQQSIDSSSVPEVPSL